MTQTHTISGFRLEPGEVIGGRFRIERCDETDPIWPAFAVDVLNQQRRAQLAVRPVGPWMPQTPTTQRWDQPWPDPHPTCLLPQIDCPDLRHGGGVLAVSATPYYPSLFGDGDSYDPDTTTRSGAWEFDDTVFKPDPAMRHRLALLSELRLASSTIQSLHHSNQAHGSLERSDFRCDDAGNTRLRHTPESGRRATHTQHGQAADLKALQQMVCGILTRNSISLLSGSVVGDDVMTIAPIRAGLRSLLHQRFRKPSSTDGIASWRLALDQLIRHIEAALLTEDARQARYDVIDALIRGDLDRAICDTASSPDSWCKEMTTRLSRRCEVTQADYAQWLDEHRDLALHTSCEQLLELMQRGFELPGPLPIIQMERRLTGSIHHLRAAATAIRNQSWQHAHDALSAAVSLDPANPILTTLATITPAPGTPGISGAP